MSGAREAILDAIRRSRAEPGGAAALPEPGRFPRLRAEELVGEFTRRLEQMGGSIMQPGPTGDALAPARAMRDAAGISCSATPELSGTRVLRADTPPASLHDVELGIVRARFGVAETGSVALTGPDLVVNTLGYLSQHLLVLLDPDRIVGNLHDAYARQDFDEAAYLVLQTGPSATADIEGVLIRGAQGVRSLTVLLVPGAA